MAWDRVGQTASLAARGKHMLTAPLRRLMPFAALGLAVFAVFQI